MIVSQYPDLETYFDAVIADPLKSWSLYRQVSSVKQRQFESIMESYVRTTLHDLTPVRIRGKRYAPGQKSAIQTKQNNTYTTFASTPENSKRSHVSRLETLPTELLHLVFRFCPNIYLPLASPTLGQILSHKAIKTYIVIQTLSDQQTSIHVVAKASGHTSIASLQSEVLNRKWLTYEFLRDALREAVKHLCPDGFSFNATNGDSDENSNLSDSATDSDLISTSSYAYLGRIPKEYKGAYLDSQLDLTPCTAVPVKLLHGPWTASKITLLRSLFRAGASIERVTSTDDEVASASLLEALKSSNRIAALALLPWPRKGYPRGLEFNFDRPNIGVIPDTSHLRAAILEGGCDREIVLTMLLLPDTEIDFEDRAVWKWIHDSISSGDGKGLWLKRVLGRMSISAKDPSKRLSLMEPHFKELMSRE